MNKKTLTQIDYYRIRDEIAEYCVSQEGKKNILEREPFKDIEEIVIEVATKRFNEVVLLLFKSNPNNYLK